MHNSACTFPPSDAPRETPAEFEFTVCDNGISLDMAFADRIFEVFQRLHRVDEHEGTGSGLAICKKILEAHGGRVWVESAPGQGAAFRFTIPERPFTTSGASPPLRPTEDCSHE